MPSCGLIGTRSLNAAAAARAREPLSTTTGHGNVGRGDTGDGRSPMRRLRAWPPGCPCVHLRADPVSRGGPCAGSGSVTADRVFDERRLVQVHSSDGCASASANEDHCALRRLADLAPSCTWIAQGVDRGRRQWTGGASTQVAWSRRRRGAVNCRGRCPRQPGRPR